MLARRLYAVVTSRRSQAVAALGAVGVWPKDAPDAEELVELTFDGARCVAVNGKRLSPLEVISLANTISPSLSISPHLSPYLPISPRSR